MSRPISFILGDIKGDCKRIYTLVLNDRWSILLSMDNATQLQNKDIEPTDKRVEIYSLFASSKIPLSVSSLISQLRVKRIHRSTVFRAVKLLEEKGLIIRIDFAEGESRFEIASLPHHHYALCRTCGAMECIDTCMFDDVKKLLKRRAGFSTLDHSFTLYGVCKKCNELV